MPILEDIKGNPKRRVCEWKAFNEYFPASASTLKRSDSSNSYEIDRLTSEVTNMSKQIKRVRYELGISNQLEKSTIML